jgi:hypothetical protein
MAGAPKGNKNAKGNKGGGAPVMNDRVLAAAVRNLTMLQILDIYSGEHPLWSAELQRQVILKLASTVLPRLNEHSGEDGGPIEQRIIYLPQRNERMEATSRTTDPSITH